MKARWFIGINSTKYKNKNTTSKTNNTVSTDITTNNSFKTTLSTVINNPYTVANMPGSKKFWFRKFFQRSNHMHTENKIKDDDIDTVQTDKKTGTKQDVSERCIQETNNNEHGESLGRRYASDTDLTKVATTNHRKKSYNKQHKQHKQKQRISSGSSSRKSSDTTVSNTNVHNGKDSIQFDAMQPHAMMFYAVLYKDYELLEQLITNNTDIKINSLNEDGISIIHFAAMVGSTECIQMLAKFGADIDIEDIRGNPPLHYAISMKQYEFAGALLEIGARTNVLNKKRFPELRNKNHRLTWYTS